MLHPTELNLNVEFEDYVELVSASSAKPHILLATALVSPIKVKSCNQR